MDTAVATGRKPRVLYFIVRYPNFSETYMHEEMRTVRDEFDLGIVTYKVSDHPRRNPFPYEVIDYDDTCLVYGKFDKIDQEFQSAAQQEFLQKVGAVIERFRPDVLHAHYFGLGLLLEQLARRHQVPFTIRTHSMDVLSEPPAKLAALCAAANSPWCLRVLAFPTFRQQLIGIGLHPDKVVACWPAVAVKRFLRPERRPPTGRVMCVGPAIKKKAHSEFVDLAWRMRRSGLTFDLYARGMELENTRAYNARSRNVVNVTYADPEDMPEVYPRYDWLVYPSDTKINKVGLPTAIAEAQAAGLGVCWQELPGRREEQLDFLGGAGFLFRSIKEVPAILGRPYPEEMRLRGLENARKCDIEEHKGLLTDAWRRWLMRPAASGSTQSPLSANL